MTENGKLLTIDEVADQLSASRAWVRDHCSRREPRIPVVRMGNRRALLRFRQEDITAFINKHLSCTERSA
jgi:hypothetical protein